MIFPICMKEHQLLLFFFSFFFSMYWRLKLFHSMYIHLWRKLIGDSNHVLILCLLIHLYTIWCWIFQCTMVHVSSKIYFHRKLCIIVVKIYICLHVSFNKISFHGHFWKKNIWMGFLPEQKHRSVEIACLSTCKWK